MANSSKTNINTINASYGSVRAGLNGVGRSLFGNDTRDISLMDDEEKKKLNRIGAASVGNVVSSTFQKEMEDDSMVQTSNDSQEILPPNADQQWYDSFMKTVGPYVSMSDEEKRYYYNQSSIMASNGIDPREWAEEFITINGISNATGLSKEEVMLHKDDLQEYFAGQKAPHLTFTSGYSIINSFMNGVRQQELASLKDDYRSLMMKGYEEDSEEVQNKARQIMDKAKQMEYYQDSTPHHWTINLLNNAVAQIPYMTVGEVSGAVGGLIGGALGFTAAGPAGAAIGKNVGSYLSRFITYSGQFSGDAYWNMREAGLDNKTALRYSAVDGLINGLNEALLDKVFDDFGEITGLSKSLYPNFLKKVTSNADPVRFGMRMLWYMGTDAAGEFIQEGSESLTSSLIMNFALWRKDLRDNIWIDEKQAQDALNEAVAGFATGLVFGLRNTAAYSIADYRSLTKLKNNAHSTPSEEVFVKSKENRELLENMRLSEGVYSEEEVDTVLKDFYESASEAREAIKKAGLAKGVETMGEDLDNFFKNGATITTGNVYDDEGNVISGKNAEIKRSEDGSLVYTLDTSKDVDGNDTYTMRFGNAGVIGRNEAFQAALLAKGQDNINRRGEEVLATPSRSMAMEQIGSLSFTIDEDANTLTITGVDMRNDASLTEEAVRQVMDMYSEYDIKWDAKAGVETEAREKISMENPRGYDKGLNYRERTFDSKDKAEVVRWIGDNFARNSAERSMLAAIVQGAARRMNLSGMDFINRYFNPIRKADPNDFLADAKESLRRQGKTSWTQEELDTEVKLQMNGAKAYTKATTDLQGQIKATIYAGTKGDVTSFMHELDHSIMLIGDNMKEFTELFHKVKDTSRFKAFVKRNLDIIGELRKKNAEGKVIVDKHGNYELDEEKLAGLFKDADNWTRDDFEFEARLAEAARRAGETLNPEMKGFFRRVAQIFRDVYRALRNGFGNVHLNDEVVEYLDRLYGFDKDGKDSGKDFSNARMKTIGTLKQAKSMSEQQKLDKKHRRGEFDDEEELKEWVAEQDLIVIDGVSIVPGIAKNKFLPRNKELGTAKIMDLITGNRTILLSGNMKIKSIMDRIGTPKTPDAVNALVNGRTTEFKRARSDSGKVNINTLADNVADALEKSEDVVVVSFDSLLGLDEKKLWRRVTKNLWGTEIKQGTHNVLLLSQDLAYATLFEVKKETANSAISYSGRQWVERISTLSTQLNDIISKYFVNKETENKAQYYAEYLSKQEKTSLKQLADYSEEAIADGRYDDQILEERQQVVDKYKGTDQWMKAPNGQPTNLTEDQWIAVRTPSFLSWGGDWINDPENASVILGSDGEPEVMFHSTSKEFEAFDLSMAYPGTYGLGIYLSRGSKFWPGMPVNLQMFARMERRMNDTPLSEDKAKEIIQRLIDRGGIEPREDADVEISADNVYDLLDGEYSFHNLTSADLFTALADGWDNISDKGVSIYQDATTELFKEMGYDGLTSKGYIISLDAHNLKSATDNNGHFDGSQDSFLRQQLDDVASLSPEEQYEYVKKQYEGTDKYLMAPNGKATNLTEKQWITVRTPNFMRWSNGWDSVIKDENGEPKKLFHGSRFAERTDTLDPRRGFNINATWFSDERAIASHWSSTSDSTRFDRDALLTMLDGLSTPDELINFAREELGITLSMRHDTITEEDHKTYGLPSWIPVGDFYGYDMEYAGGISTGQGRLADSSEEWVSKVKDMLSRHVHGVTMDGGYYGHLYEGFVRMEKPLTVDAKGHAYHDIYFNRLRERVNTETIASWAKEHGYDGVVVKNVYETDYENAEGTDYIVFDAPQFKSSLDNNGMFSDEDSFLKQQIYHGSGVDFDKFDTQFIGSADGQMTYGYGFYFTASRDKAEYFAFEAKKKTGKAFLYNIETPPVGKTIYWDWSPSLFSGMFGGFKITKFMTGVEETFGTRIYEEGDTFGEFYQAAYDRVKQATGLQPREIMKAFSELLHDAGAVAIEAEEKRRDRFGNPTTTYVFFDPQDIELGEGNKEMIERDSFLKQIESYDPPTSDNFRRWFGDSKIVNEDGTPMVVYHGSRHPGFTVFDTYKSRKNSNLGSHFGTFDQATTFDDNEDNLYRVYLRIENPLRTEDIFAQDTILEEVALAGRLATDLGEEGKADLEWLRRYFPWLDDAMIEAFDLEDPNGFYLDYMEDSDFQYDLDWETSKGVTEGRNGTGEFFGRLVDLIKRSGYDGIVYANAVEGFGDDSYIVFEPNQVKSATDNNGDYSLENNDILKQTAFHGSDNIFGEFDARYIGSATVGRTSQLRWGPGFYFSLDEDVANGYGPQVYRAELPDDGYLHDLETVPQTMWDALAEEIADYNGEDIDDVRMDLSYVGDKGRDFLEYTERVLGEEHALEWFTEKGIVGFMYQENGYSGPTTNLVIFSKDSIRNLTRRNQETLEYDEGDSFLQQKVTDPELIREFNEASKDEYVVTHRSMQLIDGKLYPPMANVIRGKRQDGLVPGDVFQADENPDLAKPVIDKKTGKQKIKRETGRPVYKFDLKKGGYEQRADGSYVLDENGNRIPLGNVPADYNPYVHSTASWLNDQFESAYKRPNLVTVEVKVLKRDIGSGYWADKAALPVGEHAWKSGKVSSALKGYGVYRNLILSQYCQIMRVIPDSEVADNIADLLKDKPDVVIPDNTVSPSLLSELMARNVNIRGTDKVREYNTPGTVADADSRLDQKVYHGSPVWILDELSTNFIGRGEGAQVHGWGVYLTKSQMIANAWYREKLLGKKHRNFELTIDGQPLSREVTEFANNHFSLYRIADGEGTIQESAEWHINHLRNGDGKYGRDYNIEIRERQLARIDADPKMSIKKFLEGVPADELYRFKTTVEFARKEAKRQGVRADISFVRDQIMQGLQPLLRARNQDYKNAAMLEAVDWSKVQVYEPKGTILSVEIPEDEDFLNEQETLNNQPEDIRDAFMKVYKDIMGIDMVTDKEEAIAMLTELHEDGTLSDALYRSAKSDIWFGLRHTLTDKDFRNSIPLDRIRDLDYFSLDGGKLYNLLVRHLDEEDNPTGDRDDKIVSLKLADAGIKGIKYDGRRDGECFVIFRDEDMQVTDRQLFQKRQEEYLDKAEEISDDLMPESPQDDPRKKILFQYLGVFGTSRLNRENMKALETAEEMLLEKKPMKLIKLLTGWEMGPNEEWYFEIPDGTMTEIPKGGQDLKLSELYKAPDLYRAYPDLADVTIAIDDDYLMKNESILGYCDKAANRIGFRSTIFGKSIDKQIEELNRRKFESPEYKAYIEARKAVMNEKTMDDRYAMSDEEYNTWVVDWRKRLKDLDDSWVNNPVNVGFNRQIDDLIAGDYRLVPTDETLSVIVHEVQHYIQEKEGYARGGNREMRDAIAKGTIKEFTKRSEDLRTKLETVSKRLESIRKDIAAIEEGKVSNLAELSEDTQERWFVDIRYTYLDSPSTSLHEQLQAVLEIEEERLSSLNAMKGNQDRTLEYTARLSRMDDYDFYRRLLGELNARAAGSRSNLTMDERRQSIMADTYDTKDGDVIILKRGDDSTFVDLAEYRKMMNGKSRDFYSGDRLDQKAFHGSPYRILDNPSTSHIGEGEGNQVHGWGVYVAKSYEIADERYRKRLLSVRRRDFDIDFRELEFSYKDGTAIPQESSIVADRIAKWYNDDVINSGEWRDRLRRHVDFMRGTTTTRTIARELQENLDNLPDQWTQEEFEEYRKTTHGKVRQKLRALAEKAKKNGTMVSVEEVREAILKEKAVWDNYVADYDAQIAAVDAVDWDSIEAKRKVSNGTILTLEVPEDDELLTEYLPLYRQPKEVQDILKGIWPQIYGYELETDISKIQDMIDDLHDKGRLREHWYDMATRIVSGEFRATDDRFDELSHYMDYSEIHMMDMFWFRGEDIYERISRHFSNREFSNGERPDKQASLFLKEHGIKGIKYNGQTDGECFVIFADEDIEVTDRKLFQKLQQVGDDAWTAEVKQILAEDPYDYEGFVQRVRDRMGDEGEGPEARDAMDDIFSQESARMAGDEAWAESFYDGDIDQDYPEQGTDQDYPETGIDQDYPEDDGWSVEEFGGEEGTAAMAMDDGDLPDWMQDDYDPLQGSSVEEEEATEAEEDAFMTTIHNAYPTAEEARQGAKLSLDSPSNSQADMGARANEFARIIADDKAEAKRFLQALRRVNDIFFSGDVDQLWFDPEEDPELYSMMSTANDDLEDGVSPFIRNLVYVTKGSDATKLENLGDRAWHIVAGQVASNPELYMDLYYRATGNDAWSGYTSLETRVRQELGMDEKVYKALSFTEKRRIAQDIDDIDLRARILRNGDVTDADLKGYVQRTQAKMDAVQAELKALEEARKYTVNEKNGEIVKLNVKAQRLEEELSKVTVEKAEVADKIERNIRRMENMLRAKGVPSVTDTQVQSELKKRQAALERRQRQLELEEARQRKADTYFSKAGYDEQQRIKALIDEASRRLQELEGKEILTPEEALERLQDLYAAWKDERVAKAIEAVNRHRDELAKNAKDRADARLSKAVDKERDKADKRLKDARQRREDAIRKLKEEYRDKAKAKAAARRMIEEKKKLARAIMRKPSDNVNIDEAEKIRAIQATLDPAFRKKVKANGQMVDINELKEKFRKDPDDPTLSGLTETQLSRIAKKSLDEMTLAELESIKAAVDALRSEGLQKRMAYVISEKQRIRAIQSEMIDMVRSNENYREPGFRGDQAEANRKKSLPEKFRTIYLGTYNMARKAQMLDGDKKGIFYEVLVRMKRRVQDIEMKAQLERVGKVQEVMKDSGVDPDDLYQVHQVQMDKGVMHLTTSQLAYIYLAANNERNRDAIAYGTLVTSTEHNTLRAGVEASIIGDTAEAKKARSELLDERVRQIGDARWDIVYNEAKALVEGNGALRQVVEAIEADFNSTGFQRVVDLMRKVYNQDVERESYYLPNNRTGFAGTEPAEKLRKDVLNMVPGTKGTVEKGFTKSRVTVAPQHQIEVDFDLFKIWQQSVRDQEHLLASLEYVRTLNGIFETKGTGTASLRAEIESTFGSAMMDAIDMHLKEIADPDAGNLQKNPGDELLKLMKGNVYSAYLGFKLSAFVNQLITSPAAFLGKVSPVRLAGQMLKFTTSWKSSMEKVYALSPFMRSRSYDIIAGEIRDAATEAGMPKYKKLYAQFLDLGLKSLEFVDEYCVGAGWMAIYEQEIERLGGIESVENAKEAARIADEYVMETQPLSDKTELAPMFKYKSEAMNILTQFQSSLNVVWQNVTYDIPKAFQNHAWRTAMGTIVGYMMAGALLELVHGGWKRDDEPWWRRMLRFLFGSTTQFIEGIPLVSGQVEEFLKALVYGEKPRLSLGQTVLPAVTKDIQALGKAAEGIWSKDPEDFQKALEYGVDGAMLTFGFPYSLKNELKAVKDNGPAALVGYRK